jgi:hypothetical protein
LVSRGFATFRGDLGGAEQQAMHGRLGRHHKREKVEDRGLQGNTYAAGGVTKRDEKRKEISI